MFISSDESNSNYAIIYDNLKKYYGTTCGLREGFCCKIRKGESTVLLGSNGAGKSTLMNITTNIIFPDEGNVLISGIDSFNPVSRNSLRYLPEDVVLPSQCTTLDLLREYQAHRSNMTVKDVESLAEIFGCFDKLDQRFTSMSKGQKRLMLLTLILSGDPAVIILDEPMEGLDPINIHEVRERIRQLCDRGTTVLQSTHRIHEAQKHQGNYMIIHDGKFLTEGKLASIKQYCKMPRSCVQRYGFQPEDIFLSGRDVVIINRRILTELTCYVSMESDISPVCLEDIYLNSVR